MDNTKALEARMEQATENYTVAKARFIEFMADVDVTSKAYTELWNAYFTGWNDAREADNAGYWGRLGGYILCILVALALSAGITAIIYMARHFLR